MLPGTLQHRAGILGARNRRIGAGAASALIQEELLARIVHGRAEHACAFRRHEEFSAACATKRRKESSLVCDREYAPSSSVNGVFDFRTPLRRENGNRELREEAWTLVESWCNFSFSFFFFCLIVHFNKRLRQFRFLTRDNFTD